MPVAAVVGVRTPCCARRGGGPPNDGRSPVILAGTPVVGERGAQDDAQCQGDIIDAWYSRNRLWCRPRRIVDDAQRAGLGRIDGGWRAGALRWCVVRGTTQQLRFDQWVSFRPRMTSLMTKKLMVGTMSSRRVIGVSYFRAMYR
ncbi:hypothetical protein Jiend_51290 [Micromonospora endophytica]|nr:hypothetical protein Jiend_51290 [Micromonospora endophytica]